MNARELLIAAKEKIKNKENWTQNYNAIDNVGNNISPHHHRAVAWCSMGGLWAARYSKGQHCFLVDPRDHIRARYALNEASQELSGNSEMVATRFNDFYSHPEVLQMFDLAISRLQDPNYNPQLWKEMK